MIYDIKCSIFMVYTQITDLIAIVTTLSIIAVTLHNNTQTFFFREVLGLN